MAESAYNVMSCFHPITAYRSKSVNPQTGKRSLVFDKAKGFTDLPVTISCGNCQGCRQAKTKEWSTRSIHESRFHDSNFFITYTYDEDHLPPGSTLFKKDLQDHHKRLREKCGSFRFIACGEYGENKDRPHYHGNYFGLTIPDLKPHSKNEMGDQLFTSEILSKTWGKGRVIIGFFSSKTADYVAGYVFKKINGEMADEYYSRLDSSTGEIFQVEPEFALRSCRPAIGLSFYEKYHTDVFPSDFHIVKGRKVPSAKYYRRKLETENPDLFKTLKKRRIKDALSRSADNTPERLESREICLKAKIKQKSRTF